MQHLIAGITHLIATLGYPGVLLLMALESACIPIPSEAIMPFAGAQVTAPAGAFHPNLHVLAFVGAFGNLLGSTIAFWVGHIGGRPFLEKYGKFVLIRKRDLDKSDHFFQKYGRGNGAFQSSAADCADVYLSPRWDRAHELREVLCLHLCRAHFRSATCWLGWERFMAGTWRRLTIGFTSRTSQLRSSWLFYSPSGSGTICVPTRTRLEQMLPRRRNYKEAGTSKQIVV